MSDSLERIRHRLNEHQPSVLGSESAVETAVLIPLTVSEEAGLQVIFQERAGHLDIQPGDVCFPGGFRDSGDESPRHTALRETREELGLTNDNIRVLGEFDSMLIPWHLRILSYVGWIPDPESISPDTTEVAEVFRVAFQDIVEQEPEHHEVRLKPSPDANFPYDRIPGGKDYDWRPRVIPELFYEFSGHNVWGITARILNRFESVMKPVLDSD